MLKINEKCVESLSLHGEVLDTTTTTDFPLQFTVSASKQMGRKNKSNMEEVENDMKLFFKSIKLWQPARQQQRPSQSV